MAKNAKTFPQNIGEIYQCLASELYRKGFNYVRFHKFSTDKKALVCFAEFYNETKIDKNIGKRIKVSQSQYLRHVLDIEEPVIFNYKRDRVKYGNDPTRLKLDKQSNNWIEWPAYDFLTHDLLCFVCFFNTDNDVIYDSSVVNDCRVIFQYFILLLSRQRAEDNFKNRQELLDELSVIDYDLLNEIDGLRGTTTTNLSYLYDDIVTVIDNLIRPDIIDIRFLKRGKLLSKTHNDVFPMDKVEIDLSDRLNRLLLISQPILKRDNQKEIIANKDFFFYIGKRDKRIRKMAVDMVELSKSEKNHFFDLRTFCSVGIRSGKKMVGVLFIASSNYDFLNEYKKLVMEDFAKKISLINTIERNIATLKNNLEDNRAELIFTRRKVEERLKLLLRAEMSIRFIHDFRNLFAITFLAWRRVKRYLISNNLISSNEVSEAASIIDSKRDIIENKLNAYDDITIKPSSYEMANIVDIINEAVELAEDRLNKNKVSYRMAFSENKCIVKVKKIDLITAMYNVINNGIDAMVGGPGKKQLTIRGEKRDGEYIIYIDDTGEGIPNDIQNDIFSPGYSTKFSSGGTGIGLYSAKDIIENHKGSISIRSSKAGKGTQFEIRLPLNLD